MNAEYNGCLPYHFPYGNGKVSLGLKGTTSNVSVVYIRGGGGGGGKEAQAEGPNSGSMILTLGQWRTDHDDRKLFKRIPPSNCFPRLNSKN